MPGPAHGPHAWYYQPQAMADDGTVTHKKFAAIVTGPIKSLEKADFDETGKVCTHPGSVEIEPGMHEISLPNGQGGYRKITHPYVDLHVNFGTNKRPRWAPVPGAKLQTHASRGAPYYELAKEPEPKTAKTETKAVTHG